MDKIFDRAKSEGRGLVSDSKTPGMGVNSPAMKAARSKALKKETKKEYTKRHHNDLMKHETN